VAQKQAFVRILSYGTNQRYLNGGIDYGLVARLEQRLSYGVSFLVAYMHGKSIDEYPRHNRTTSRLRAPRRRTRRISGVIAASPASISATGLVNQPGLRTAFGKGKPYLSRNKLASAIAGGWAISGILTLPEGDHSQRW